ncbi:MAG: RT0821/Lpp0805 family surface protein [Rhodospirillales bacterium]|jgi:surface antigen|nr:RT0821/Lpp0805 family surface protein [Rhodospirillales bacterium]
MNVKSIAATLLAASLLAACQQMQDNPKQTMGTLAGAGLGALAGSQIGGGKGQLAAVAIGALAGGWFGSEIGKSLDKADQAYAAETVQNSMESNRTNQTSTWRNPDSGHAGSFTPTSTYQTASGQYCRDFETTVNIDGQAETATGRACRDDAGGWRIVQ